MERVCMMIIVVMEIMEWIQKITLIGAMQMTQMTLGKKIKKKKKMSEIFVIINNFRCTVILQKLRLLSNAANTRLNSPTITRNTKDCMQLYEVFQPDLPN